MDILEILFGLFGIGFGVWQYKKATNLQKVVNDHVRGLYADAKQILNLTKHRKRHDRIAERVRTLKGNIIRLDITNRNLNRRKIEGLKTEGKLSPEEAEEYQKFSSD